MSKDPNNRPSLTEGDYLRLLMRHENALRAFARSMLPTWDAVDDVIQDASIVMWQKLGKLEDEHGFLPWGKVIVRFHCLRYHEKQKARRTIFSNELIALLADDAEQISEAEHSEQCLSALSAPQRELVLAPYLKHGRITELAEQSNTTVNALYKKLGRLRNQLRSCVRQRLAAV